MQEIKLIKNVSCPSADSPISRFNCDEIESHSFHSVVYYLRKGSLITFSHKKHDDRPIHPDEDERLIHFIAKGKVKYTTPTNTYIAELYDTINFIALAADVLVEVLEDSIIFSAQTNDVTTEGDKDKKMLVDQLDILEHRDKYTKTHSLHVSSYATKMALLLDEKIFLAGLGQAGSLHDIGKILVPDSILLKEGRLTDEEYEIMKKHPTDGAEMVSKVTSDKNIIEAISQHHERLDGSGYPKGLKKDEINPLAKILMVADVFDAMTTDRVYRKKLSIKEALHIISDDVNIGKLDLRVFNALSSCIEQGMIKL